MDSSNWEKRDIMLSYYYYFFFLGLTDDLTYPNFTAPIKVVRYAGNADVRLLWVYLHYLMQMKLIVPW